MCGSIAIESARSTPSSRPAQRVREHDRAAVRGVDVQPQRRAPRASVGDRRQRVDRAGRRRARGRADRERAHAGGDGRARSPPRALRARIRCSRRSRSRARRPRRGRACPRRGGSRRAPPRTRRARPGSWSRTPCSRTSCPSARVARALERDEVRHRAAGHDHPAGALGQPEALAPASASGAARSRPPPGRAGSRRGTGSGPAREQLGGRARDGAGAADVGEERRMAHAAATARTSARAGARRGPPTGIGSSGTGSATAGATSAGTNSRVTGQSRAAARAAPSRGRAPAPPNSLACSGLQARSVTGAGASGTARTLCQVSRGRPPGGRSAGRARRGASPCRCPRRSPGCRPRAAARAPDAGRRARA